MKPESKIFIAGHKGLVGSAIHRNLQAKGFNNFILRTHRELDLTEQAKVNQFFAEEQPEYVILAAAKVGGIIYNKNYPADFLYENLMIAGNVLHAAHNHQVKKLIFLGSSCIYPKFTQQPITESALLTGALEPTNEGYAIAKIAGLKLCEKLRQQYGKDFVSVMPTNLYGPYDNFHPEHSHVIPGLMRRFHEAKMNQDSAIVIWGSGRARRDFLHVEDLAEAIHTVMQQYSDAETINIGSGEDLPISELAEAIKEAVGFTGEIQYDLSKPDGTPQKLLDITKMNSLGWTPQIKLRQGLKATYEWIIKNEIFAK